MKIRKILMFLVVFALTLGICAACGERDEEPVYYTVQAQYDENLGSVTVSDPTSASGYVAGEQVTVTVTPNSGVEVKEVTLNGEEKELAEGKLTFAVSRNTTVVVTFEETATPPQEVTLTLPSDNTITAAPAGPYHAGDKVTLTITAPSGQQLKSIKVNGTEKFEDVKENTLEIELSTDTTITVEYEDISTPPQEVTLTLPTDGTVTAAPAGPYHAGDKVTLTITAPSGQQLKSIKVNGTEKFEDVKDNTLQIELSTDTTITVEYENIEPEVIEIGEEWWGYYEGTKSSVKYALRIGETKVELKIGDEIFAAGTLTEYKAGFHIKFTLSGGTWTIEAPLSGNPYQSVMLSGGPNNLGNINCLRTEEPGPEPEIPELSIPEKLVGVWTTAAGDHTMTITKTALTLDDVPATAFTSLEEASTVYYNFTAGGKDYTMMFGSDGSLSVSEKENTGNSIIFNVKDGEPIQPKEVEILEEYKGEFEGEKSGTKYHVSVKDEGIFVTIGETEPVKATLKKYEEVRGYTFTLSDETEYRLVNKGTGYDKMDFYYDSMSFVTLNRVTETEPSTDLNVDDDLVGEWTATGHTLTITKTSIDLDGKQATAYSSAGSGVYTFTIDSVEYTAMLGYDKSSLTLMGGTAGTLSFTRKSEPEPEIPELTVDSEIIGEWVAEGHTLTITATSIELDGKYATDYHKDGMLSFITYSFTVESVAYSGMLKSGNTVLTLTGFDGGSIDFTRKSESGEPDVGSDVAILDKYCGTFSAESEGKTFVITIEEGKVTITINGAEQTVTLVDFEENGGDWGNTPTITITLDGGDYAGECTLEFTTVNKVKFMKDGEQIVKCSRVNS